MSKLALESDKIEATIERLCLRIEDRFPSSGLLKTCHALHQLALESNATIAWIEKPNRLFRVVAVVLIAAIVGLLGLGLTTLEYQERYTLADIITISEAAVNELILIGVAVLFITGFESRRKRGRVIKALHALRSIAHVIDAHQLTKDPSSARISAPTPHSPERSLRPGELARYLDYCSEMLSLTGKVAYLYVQSFDDPVSIQAASDVESLTTGLSRKVWQKIMLIPAGE